MPVRLVVLSPGRWQGRAVPVPCSPFVIGRGERCHLRPASPFVSKYHCVLTACGGRGFLHDLKSSNGTLVNGRRIQGGVELRDGDRLAVGSLEFAVRLGAGTPGDWRTPRDPGDEPALRAAEEVAALLLSLEDGGDAAPGEPPRGGRGIPSG